MGAGASRLALRIYSASGQVSGEFVFQTLVDHGIVDISRCLLLRACWPLNDHWLHWTLGGRQSLVLIVIVSVSAHYSLLNLCWQSTVLQLEFGHGDAWSLFS